MTTDRFYNDSDNRQCAAVDLDGLDCAAPKGHELPHANINGRWDKESDDPTAFPQAWVDAAAEAAHRALDDVDDGWHYTCMNDPDDQSCYKGDYARRMLAEDVMPAVLAALAQQGALVQR